MWNWLRAVRAKRYLVYLLGLKFVPLIQKYNGASYWFCCRTPGFRKNEADKPKKIITLKCFDAKEASNPDNDRKQYGNNRYSQSNIDQWLNSAAGAWGMVQRAIPTTHRLTMRMCIRIITNTTLKPVFFLTLKNHSGMLSLIPRSGLQRIPSPTAEGYEDITRKVYLLSNTEVGLGNESVAEGSKMGPFQNDNSRKHIPTAEAVSASEYTIPA